MFYKSCAIETSTVKRHRTEFEKETNCLDRMFKYVTR